MADGDQAGPDIHGVVILGGVNCLVEEVSQCLSVCCTELFMPIYIPIDGVAVEIPKIDHVWVLQM